jgi:hypothetical protein
LDISSTRRSTTPATPTTRRRRPCTRSSSR